MIPSANGVCFIMHTGYAITDTVSAKPLVIAWIHFISQWLMHERLKLQCGDTKVVESTAKVIGNTAHGRDC